MDYNESDEVIYDFQGQPIRLPWERWLHIIDPARGHGYMASMRSELAETLLDPEIIRWSNSEPEAVKLYYKWTDNTVVGAKWVCVVVRTFDDGDAYVRTAYVTYRPKRGKELWRKENQ